MDAEDDKHVDGSANTSSSKAGPAALTGVCKNGDPVPSPKSYKRAAFPIDQGIDQFSFCTLFHFHQFTRIRVDEFRKYVFLSAKVHPLLRRAFPKDNRRGVGVSHAFAEETLIVFLESFFYCRDSTARFSPNHQFFKTTF